MEITMEISDITRIAGELPTEVKDTARDTVYAAIGFATISAQQLQEQLRKAGELVAGQRGAAREQVTQIVEPQFAALKDLQTRLSGSVEQLRGRVDELVKATEARDALGERLPEPVKATVDQLRTQVGDLAGQVNDLADQVRSNALKLVQRAA
jgi:uncharacterized phage infection (PIP) family protein YhgE